MRVRRPIALAMLLSGLGASSFARAAEPADRGEGGGAPPAQQQTADRMAVRFVSPETGGMARPRFITDRELALYTRFEARMADAPTTQGEYPERFVRSALDRMVARTMLAGLLIQRGQEPPDLPRLVDAARLELADRVGGLEVLDQILVGEGVTLEELNVLLRDQVRAFFYVDKAITPIGTITEDSLREAFRSATHPFRGGKFEDVRSRLRRWVSTERLRETELEFLQSARSRTTIVALHPLTVQASSAVRPDDALTSSPHPRENPHEIKP